ncbi:MAG TPA: hypothetical protein VH858_13695 [Hyphomicrobiales bacterium]|jgi:hypothetical protein
MGDAANVPAETGKNELKVEYGAVPKTAEAIKRERRSPSKTK